MVVIVKKNVLVTLVDGPLILEGGVRMIKSAVFFFKDVFYVLPFRSTDMGGRDTYFNGDEIYAKAEPLLNDGKFAELYDFLDENISEDLKFRVSVMQLFRIKVGWGPFGVFQFKKDGKTGVKNLINIKKKAERQELKDFYNL